jgi:hypothetical protein
MNDLVIWSVVVSLSLILGALHYNAGYYADIDKHNGYFKFLEFLKHTINYFISLTILYYLISVRGEDIIKNNRIYSEDLILGAVFLMGIFGWLPYFVKNITEGINAIFARVFNK